MILNVFNIDSSKSVRNMKFRKMKFPSSFLFAIQSSFIKIIFYHLQEKKKDDFLNCSNQKTASPFID